MYSSNTNVYTTLDRINGKDDRAKNIAIYCATVQV